MASKKVKVKEEEVKLVIKIEDKLTDIKNQEGSEAKYSDIFIEVLSSVAPDGVTISEMDAKIRLIVKINESTDNIEFSNRREVEYLAVALANHKFNFIHIDLIRLQAELNSLLK